MTESGYQIKQVKISELIPHAMNPRNHPDRAIDSLVKSIQEFGFTNPILVSEDGIVLAGHARIKAAKKAGLKEVPVLQLPLSGAKADAYLIADNKLQELTEWNLPTLKDLLCNLDDGAFDMDLTGFSADEIEDLMTQTFEPKAGLTDDDAIPEKVETICKKGDLWKLGNHRLLCGDSTVITDVEKLMGGEKADILLTDPPYGINIVHGGRANTTSMLGFVGIEKKPSHSLAHARAYSPIINDDKPFDPTLLLSYGDTKIIFGANNFASKLPDSCVWLVWDKKVEGGLDHNNFSDIELAWTNSNKKACLIYRHLWSGLLREGDRKTELKDRVHPTQKPVGLFVQILKDFEGENVLDLYGGSGSTLIACEKLDRQCFMAELSPDYCDVILKRWEDFTGQKAELIV